MKDLLAQLASGRSLDADQATDAFEQIMTGAATPAQTAALLALIAARGATIDELVGAATVMRRKVAPVPVPEGMRVIDTCGTGGDHTPTFNISTCAAIAAAAVGHGHGVGVAKHGNRTVTRASGSSQALEALGVKLDVSPAVQTRCLAEAGFCFCFAPAHHPAMKHAMPVRQELGFRTMFNLLGPLTNPAGADSQLLGVFDPALTEPLATVLARLGGRRAMVVHGYKGEAKDAGGFCELSISGPSRISEVVDGQVQTRELDAARELGLARAALAEMLVQDPAHSAAVMRRVLEGEDGPARQIVCLNAAASLVVADLAADLAEGLALAQQAIDRGAARQTLEQIVRITNDAGA